ncbi:MAG: SoxR reducing system RseC family protein [Tissierellia bacterium]|nr:SoxR reducing system RseC family protein [Tissierellia bacterium]
MIRIGWVAKVKDNRLTIHVPRVSGCGGNCNSCGASCETSIHVVETANTLGAKEGDFVELAFSEVHSLRISLLIYILPLLFFIIGIVFASKFFDMSEIQSLGIGFVMLILSFICLYFVDKRLKKRVQDSIILRSIIQRPFQNNS